MIHALMSDVRRVRLTAVGAWMKQLIEWRVRADYRWESTSNLSLDDAMDAIDVANKVAVLIAGLTPTDWAYINQRIDS